MLYTKNLSTLEKVWKNYKKTNAIKVQGKSLKKSLLLLPKSTQFIAMMIAKILEDKTKIEYLARNRLNHILKIKQKKYYIIKYFLLKKSSQKTSIYFSNFCKYN